MKTSPGFRKIASSVALCACSSVTFSHDFGVVGPVYPIVEQDIRVTMEQRLEALKENGELARIEDNAKARFRAYANRPTGIALPRATRDRIYYIDPSITVPYDVKDNQGRIIYPAGTTVNPLEHMNLKKKLVIFDGDDAIQVNWARSMIDTSPAQVKPVLIKGPVVDLMKQWKVPIYFDQRGRLVDHFDIKSLPATVSQDGKRIKIMERNLDEAG